MDRSEINRKKQQFIYPAISNYFSDPLPLERGEMQHVWDVEGKRYLDFFGGIVTVGVGHANPRITGPVKAQMDKLGHTSTLYPHQTMVELAEKIAQITPGKLEKSFFTTSGTEANETAIDSARMHTGNLEIIALRHQLTVLQRTGKARRLILNRADRCCGCGCRDYGRIGVLL